MKRLPPETDSIPARPALEQMTRYTEQSCGYDDLVHYLAAGPRDAWYGLSLWHFVPTRAEWARGVRLVRCDVVVGPQDSSHGYQTSFRMRNIMLYTRSAAIRRCAAGPRTVTCDQPHDAEYVNAQLPWSGSQQPAPDDRRGVAACKPFVQQYLGVPLSHRPDLAVKVLPPLIGAWSDGTHAITCWVGPKTRGRQVIGTLRGGLKVR